MFGLKGRRSPQNLGCFQMILFQSGTTIANTNFRHHDFEVIGQRLVIFYYIAMITGWRIWCGDLFLQNVPATICINNASWPLAVFESPIIHSVCSPKFAEVIALENMQPSWEPLKTIASAKLGEGGRGANRVYCGKFEKTEPFKPLVPVYVEVGHPRKMRSPA